MNLEIIGTINATITNEKLFNVERSKM